MSSRTVRCQLMQSRCVAAVPSAMLCCEPASALTCRQCRNLGACWHGSELNASHALPVPISPCVVPISGPTKCAQSPAPCRSSHGRGTRLPAPLTAAGSAAPLSCSSQGRFALTLVSSIRDQVRKQIWSSYATAACVPTAKLGKRSTSACSGPCDVIDDNRFCGG